MRSVSKTLQFAVVVGALAFPSFSRAQHYVQKNLVSNRTDQGAELIDPNLANPWGLTRAAGSPFWVANNNSQPFGTSTLYTVANTKTGLTVAPAAFFPDPAGSAIDNFVIIPPPGFQPPGSPSTPTGAIFNGNPNAFQLNKGVPIGQFAIFMFVTEDGTISGWNPGVNVRKGNSLSIDAVLEVDNSDNGSNSGAVYKGATTALVNGKVFLYVTNFRSGEIEVYDSNFKRVHFGDDAFKVNGDRDGDDEDNDRGDRGDRIPRGFSPFNVQNIGGSLFVTYAKQDGPRHDPVGGTGLGFVEIFTPEGKLIGHLQHGPWMNAPWGVVWTPRDFGRFSNSILVGNFRSGWIAAFNGFTHEFEGFLKNPDNSLVFNSGIWSLTFGNDGAAGPAETLFFTAGLNSETDGLFGALTPVPAEEDGSIE